MCVCVCVKDIVSAGIQRDGGLLEGGCTLNTQYTIKPVCVCAHTFASLHHRHVSKYYLNEVAVEQIAFWSNKTHNRFVILMEAPSPPSARVALEAELPLILKLLFDKSQQNLRGTQTNFKTAEWRRNGGTLIWVEVIVLPPPVFKSPMKRKHFIF